MPEMPPRPAIADAPLSMILVACNAELFLDHLLDRWRGALKSRAGDFEIVLVDDASTDGTHAQAELWQSEHAELKVVRSEAPHGAGAAWRAGLAARNSNPLLGFAEFSPPPALRPAPSKGGKGRERAPALVPGSRPARAGGGKNPRGGFFWGGVEPKDSRVGGAPSSWGSPPAARLWSVPYSLVHLSPS